MVNLLQLSALFAYDLKSVAYKPIPGSGGISAASNFNSSQHSNGSAPLAASAAHVRQRSTKKHKPGKSLDTTDDSSSCNVEPYDAPEILGQDFPPYDQTTANVYRYRQQQSVNLGSWFVNEKWMTPSLFKCASGAQGAEIDIANGWGSVDNARAVLERHWDTFITESDFEYLANIGINTVRLPIGYWNLGPKFTDNTAFESVAQVYENCWPRIVRAINQAGNAGIGVLVDLHGAVGSQNGQPHSGVSDGQTNFFSEPSNMDKTVDVLTFLAQQLGSVNNIVGIQILNEPQYTDTLTDFYSRAIDAMRSTCPAAKSLPLYVHDGFDLDRLSSYVASRTDFVVQDHHSYFVFSPSDQKESGSQHTVDVDGAISQSLVRVSNKQRRNLVVDEWSCALTPESLESEGDADKVRKEFCTEQMKVYSNATAGWGFWSYKKEGCESDPGWCFTSAVGKSLPSTFFAYGKAASMKEANNLAKDVSDNLIIPTVTENLLNLVQQNRPSSSIEHHERYAFGPLIRRRFEAIHQHRDAQSGQDTDSWQQSTSRGYTDGFTTAKVFASYNMSKVGFTGQFMMDAIEVAGPTLIAQGTEDGYHDGFMHGLRDGEKLAGAP
ncbi:glycoside hydrolase superfamily [Flammula alnicola]|nr:glycoside hydrolase superfamily [Flammula alnicola]